MVFYSLKSKCFCRNTNKRRGMRIKSIVCWSEIFGGKSNNQQTRTINTEFGGQKGEFENSIIASLGPAIIKAGQALASRPDLLPSEYLEELQQLQDNVPTFSNDIAFKIVEEELGQQFSDVFELVEPEPIAGELNALL